MEEVQQWTVPDLCTALNTTVSYLEAKTHKHRDETNTSVHTPHASPLWHFLSSYTTITQNPNGDIWMAGSKGDCIKPLGHPLHQHLSYPPSPLLSFLISKDAFLPFPTHISSYFAAQRPCSSEWNANNVQMMTPHSVNESENMCPVQKYFPFYPTVLRDGMIPPALSFSAFFTVIW